MNAKGKFLLAGFLAACLFLTGCGSAPYGKGEFAPGEEGFIVSGDEFEAIDEQGFVSAAEAPESYFSLDVNTASYSYTRAAIRAGRLPDPDAVRIEEMLNYFPYDYPAPEDSPLAVSGGIFDCPWNAEHKLMRVGIRTASVELGNKANNIVFLIDSSGSMYGADRLGLLQRSFAMLAEKLTANDRVSVVTYAGSSRVVLSGVPGNRSIEIVEAIQSLEAGGGTAGAEGIRTAYELARQYRIEGGNNRVILATDGDFNVGVSSQAELETLIKQEAGRGVYLTVLGFGMGNYKDNKMETLVKNGDGNYFYIDSLFEAEKVLVGQLGGTLVAAARDAKAAVTFDPRVVSGYRLLGYDNKRLTEEEWQDQKTDAGELGSGLTVTALYELEMIGQGTAAEASVRYKDPDTTDDAEREITAEIGRTIDDADARFAAAVAMFGLILRDSPYKGTADMDKVLALLTAEVVGNDPYRADFLQVATAASQLL